MIPHIAYVQVGIHYHDSKALRGMASFFCFHFTPPFTVLHHIGLVFIQDTPAFSFLMAFALPITYLKKKKLLAVLGLRYSLGVFYTD